MFTENDIRHVTEVLNFFWVENELRYPINPALINEYYYGDWSKLPDYNQRDLNKIKNILETTSIRDINKAIMNYNNAEGKSQLEQINKKAASVAKLEALGLSLEDIKNILGR